MHLNLPSSPDNVVERSQQFPLQQPSQHSLPNINVPTQLPVGSGQNEVAHSDDDDDTLTEYSSHGKQHDFNADSDSESDTESGEVLDSIIGEIEEEFDNIIELCGRFRGSLDEMMDADTDKKKKIQKKVAALIVKIFYESVGINTEDLESDEDADESEEDESVKDEQEEDDDADGEEEERRS